MDEYEFEYSVEGLDEHIQLLKDCVKNKVDILIHNEEEEWFVLGEQKVVIYSMFERYGDVDREKITIDELIEKWEEEKKELEEEERLENIREVSVDEHKQMH